ncbi:hypothetical protein BJX76DRAFT_344039 [Aspergillus varians]
MHLTGEVIGPLSLTQRRCETASSPTLCALYIARSNVQASLSTILLKSAIACIASFIVVPLFSAKKGTTFPSWPSVLGA